MLDAWIIEKLEEIEEMSDLPVLYIEPADEEAAEEEKETHEDRGVVVIDLLNSNI